MINNAVAAFVGAAVILTASGCAGGETGGGAEGDAPGAPEGATAAGAGSVLRLDARFSNIVPPGALIEKVADGFSFIEGPVWLSDEDALLFTDVVGNALYRWSEADSVTVVFDPYYDSELEGVVFGGPNGLTLDPQGLLVIGDHSRRQVTRREADGSLVPIIDAYEGSRLNSPNDVIFASDGTLYFTDPTYGLPGGDDSELRELDFNGIYRLPPGGALELLEAGQSMPNGLALSPDESVLYVANSDASARWMAYDVGPDGLSNSRVFLDASGTDAPGTPDGLKVDLDGNLFATGPGGVWVIAPDGTHLGTIAPDETPANVGWGEDGRTLYMTARTGLYRIRLFATGAIPGSQ